MRGIDRPTYYRRDGTPIIDLPSKPACIQWAEECEENRRVCQTKFWWGGWLSTVYLGLDHNYGPHGPPLIFESMLFGWPYETDLMGHGEFHQALPELDQWRYSTEKEAIASHSRLVRDYRYRWRAVGWKQCGSWIWEWFRAWEKGDAEKRNVWSFFEENNHPKRTIEEMTAHLEQATAKLRER